MDDEHDQCFGIISHASHLVHDKAKMKSALQELYGHLHDHFDHEEHLMHTCKYGGGTGGMGWSGHHSDHERILCKISTFLEGQWSSAAPNDFQEFLYSLECEIKIHITHYDSLYVETFHKHGIN
jgi:hemerythrin